MQTHTPGPWDTDGEEIYSMGEESVALVSTDNPAADANAVLMAAAPRLLAALYEADAELVLPPDSPLGRRIRGALTAATAVLERNNE